MKGLVSSLVVVMLIALLPPGASAAPDAESVVAVEAAEIEAELEKLADLAFEYYETKNDPAGALAVAKVAQERYCDKPAAPTVDMMLLCFRILENTVEPLLALGEKGKAIAVIETVLAVTDETEEGYAVMTFLWWLADPKQVSIQDVREAIAAFPMEGEFSWVFNMTRRSVIMTLPESRKTQALCFVDFFETHRDLKTLDACLGRKKS